MKTTIITTTLGALTLCAATLASQGQAPQGHKVAREIQRRHQHERHQHQLDGRGVEVGDAGIVGGEPTQSHSREGMTDGVEPGHAADA